MSKALLRVFVVLLGLIHFSCNGGDDNPFAPVSLKPTASFTASSTSGTAPLAVTFNASASSDSDGTIEEYDWDFGDGGSASGVVVTHTFTIASTYTVTLTVTDDSLATDTSTMTITVGSINLGGTITAPGFTAMDGDVNDPLAPYASNDTFPLAQGLSNPAMVGGFASAIGTGSVEEDPPGRFIDSADRSDFFKVSLAAGQTITLEISDFTGDSSIDLDLILYDQNQSEKTRSDEEVAERETITVESSGEYFIEVFAYAGVSKYVMSVGQPEVAGANQAVLSIDDEFVPGEVLVRFKNNVMANNVVDSLAVRAASLGLVGKAGGSGRAMLFALPDGDSRQQVMASMGIGRVDYSSLGSSVASQEARDRHDTILAVKALRKRADVASVDLNYIRHAYATPNDQYYSYQWHYPLINLPQAWEVTTDNSGSVIVAVVDTGVYMSHPDLIANLLSTGYDFISNTSISNDGDGIDPNPDDPGDANTPGGSSFHGTHVAGTVSAASNNTTGVAGASWGTKIMPIRVLGVGGGTSYDIIQGIRYAAGLSNVSGATLSQAADIINLSLGGGGYSATEQNAYTEVRNAGVIVIAAAGNENTSTLGYPASYEGVVSVSAVDMHKDRAPYSNYGTAIDVAAPGGDTSADDNGDGYQDGVLSTLVNDENGTREPSYVFYQGTSMAAPHMAGVVALMKAVHSALTPAQLDAALADGDITEDLNPVGRDDTYGHGLIDALKAVQVASDLAQTGINNPILSVSPSLLNFGSSSSSLDVIVSNGGGGTLSVASASGDADWLSVDGNGLGTYTATVDRTNLVPATYSANITFTSNAGIDKVSVSMTVAGGGGGGGSGSGNAGYHWIILIDPVTKDTYDTVQAANSDGSYNYSFSGVEAGDYFVVGGTDSDNDGFICDAGEACGGYPTVELLQAITVGASGLNSLDFPTGFTLGLDSSTAAADDQPKRRGFSRVPVGKNKKKMR